MFLEHLDIEKGTQGRVSVVCTEHLHKELLYIQFGVTDYAKKNFKRRSDLLVSSVATDFSTGVFAKTWSTI